VLQFPIPASLRTTVDVGFAIACAVFALWSGWGWEKDKLEEDDDRNGRLRFSLLSRPSTYVVLLSALCFVWSSLNVQEVHSAFLAELSYWGIFGGFVVRYWEYRGLRE
jgi:hypothetical protein